MKRTAIPFTLLLTASVRNTPSRFEASRYALAAALMMQKHPNDTLAYIPQDPNVHSWVDSSNFVDSIQWATSVVATILQAGIPATLTHWPAQPSWAHQSDEKRTTGPVHAATTTTKSPPPTSSDLPDRATDESIATQILHHRIQEGVRKSITRVVVWEWFKQKTLENDMIALITQLTTLQRITDSTYTIHINTQDTETLSVVFTNYPKLIKLFRNTWISWLITKTLSSIFQHMHWGNFDYEDKNKQRPKFWIAHESPDDIYTSLQAYAQNFSKGWKRSK